jgi:hypothetical protein
MTELHYLIVFIQEILNEASSKPATDSARAANSNPTDVWWQVQGTAGEAFTVSKAQRSEP